MANMEQCLQVSFRSLTDILIRCCQASSYNASVDEEKMPELAEKGQADTPQSMRSNIMTMLFNPREPCSPGAALPSTADLLYFGRNAFQTIETALQNGTEEFKCPQRGPPAELYMNAAYVTMIGESVVSLCR